MSNKSIKSDFSQMLRSISVRTKPELEEKLHKTMESCEEDEESPSAAEGSSTSWNERDLDWSEALYSPDTDNFFMYIESLMADHEERILSPEELEFMDMMDDTGSSEDIDKLYDVDEDDEVESAGDGKGANKFIGRQEMYVPRVRPRRRRFFGIYERVKVKSIWEKLMRLKVVRSSKKLRLMDITATTSFELNYGQEV